MALRLMAAALSALMVSSAVLAQETEERVDEVQLDDDAARLLFESGSRAYEAGRFDTALDRFSNAYRLSHRDELLYNIALCHDRMDRREEALRFYERFLAAAPEARSVPIARTRAAVLREGLSPQPEVSEDEAPARRNVAGPAVSFAIAGAGLITFAVAGALTATRFSSAEDGCEAACDPGELDRVDRSALVADVGLGVAAAGALTGLLWWVLGKRDDTSVQANASSDGASFVLQRRF